MIPYRSPHISAESCRIHAWIHFLVSKIFFAFIFTFNRHADVTSTSFKFKLKKDVTICLRPVNRFR
jgi:hypothetical protein